MILMMGMAGVGRAETHDELVSRYLRVTGAEASIMELKEQLGQSLPSSSATAPVPESVKQKIAEIMRQSFDGQSAVAQYRAWISLNLDDVELTRLIGWYESPLGAKMRGASSGRGDTTGVASFMQRLAKKPIPEKRAAIIRRLDSTLRISETAGAVVFQIMQFTSDALQDIVPQGGEKDKELMAQQKEATKNYMSMMTTAALERILIIRYRGFSDKELTDGIAFNAAGAGWKETLLTSRAFSSILEQWMTASIKNMKPYLKRLKKEVRANQGRR